MGLNKECTNRSYLFGRLLAVAEAVEKETYRKGEARVTNAMRMQLRYSEMPYDTWKILEHALNPYYSRLTSKSDEYFRNEDYFKKIVEEILDKLIPDDEEPNETKTQELNQKLDALYLLGYYNQRAEIYRPKKKEQTEQMEGMENE